MKIALLGDIAFYGKYSVENESVYDYFKGVAELLSGYDYVIGNLETPFVTDQQPYGFKSAYIKSDPVNIKLLKYLNINVVNLANNHIYDYGEKSYLLTKKILEDNNISYFGIEDKRLIIENSGNKIALHGYCCYSTNPLGIYDGKYGINELNIAVVEYNLVKYNAEGCYNIISVHCGQEHVNYPNYNHIQMARQFAEICPYLFYGHHPHVMQGIEQVNEALISYSLGNFCFDDVYTSKSKEPLITQSENNKTSFILSIELEGNTLVEYKTIPLYADDTRLRLNDRGISQKLESYSIKLEEDKEKYQTDRNLLVNRYINSRKQLRNLEWYFKRLNFRSVAMILAARLNKKRYHNNITRYLRNN